MSVPGVGYGNTAATFAAPFLSKIMLNSKVTEINHKDPNNAIISFTKNGVVSKVAAKTVLVTTSLGVLKAGSITFTPRLPGWKQDTIDNMGFGVINKCAMVWNDTEAVVWPDETWFELITPDDGTSGKWTTFLNPSRYKGFPTLVGWVGGQDARDIEAQTDDEILDDVMGNLQAMFPTIRRPDRVIITRWGQEENVRGSYCFKTVGRDFSQDAWILGHSVGSLRFAGEATAGSSWYATTVGAWKTGEKAAQEMVDELSRRLTATPAAVTDVTSWISSSTTIVSAGTGISGHIWYSAFLSFTLVYLL